MTVTTINRTLLGLTPNTDYVVRVRSYNNLGVASDWSEALIVSTQDALIEGIVLSVFDRVGDINAETGDYTPEQVGALSATASAGGDLAGNLPNPTLAAITTAAGPIGTGTTVPIITIDAKGRVTALTSTAITVITDSGWTVPILLNSWTAAGGFTIAYRKVNSQVYLHGEVTAGTTGTIAFTLPTGFRPIELVNVGIACSDNSSGNIIIGTNGSVTINYITGNPSLDGVNFFIN